MKIKNFIFAFLGKACTICVGSSLLFFIVAQIVSYSRIGAELGISFSQYLLFVLFSFVLAGASHLFLLPLNKSLNLIIHYFVCLGSFFITFVASGKLAVRNASTFLVFTLVFTFLYALFWGITLLFRFLLYPEKRKAKHAKEKAKEEAYESRFGK